jgi:hypothetical protein
MIHIRELRLSQGLEGWKRALFKLRGRNLLLNQDISFPDERKSSIQVIVVSDALKYRNGLRLGSRLDHAKKFFHIFILPLKLLISPSQGSIRVGVGVSLVDALEAMALADMTCRS